MKYSTRILLLLVCSWGMVGLERMVIAFVMPGIQQDFKLNYTQVGMVISAFGFAWAIGTWAMGSLSDYIGRRLVIVVLMIFGGICSWLTGIAGTFGILLIIRAVMGFAEGGLAGPASATLAEESPPQSRGRNMGLMTGFFVLIGGALGPILSTGLMTSLGWRPVFFVYAVPAIILGILLFLFMREPASTLAIIKARKDGKTNQKRLDGTGQEVSYWGIFKSRNIILMIFIWTAQMVWLWLFTTFGVMFMIKVHGLPLTAVGIAMTGFGIGAFLGTFILGVVSDRIGRRKANMITLLLGGILGVIFASLGPGTPLVVLFGTILLYSFAASGAGGVSWALITESAGFRFAATAIGIVTGIGELLGGGIFPAIGGGIADRLGIAATLYLTGFILISAGILSFFLKETLTRNKNVLSQ
ncbi:MAG: MFS transporter [Proteobacteria bacterium]|nr:MFS transporter [Pseudomonadota bacterium]